MHFKNEIQQLENGGVIAYPTETLWGLGADISNDSAVDKIYSLKGRQSTKALSVLVSDINMAKQLATVDSTLERLMQIFWPGSVTFVVEATENVSDLIHGGTGCVGLRCSSHEWVKEFFLKYHKPITTTSVNKSGEPPAKHKSDLSWLKDQVYIVDWNEELPNSHSMGSTVVKYSHAEIQLLRQGDVEFNQILQVLQIQR